MAHKGIITKTIQVSKNKFNLEIYTGLENISWEIFPHNYNAALYAFSNKDKLNFYESFYNLSNSINKNLSKIRTKKNKNNFFDKFGHLRPLTYSIESKNYKENFEIYFKVLKYKLFYPKMSPQFFCWRHHKMEKFTYFVEEFEKR